MQRNPKRYSKPRVLRSDHVLVRVISDLKGVLNVVSDDGRGPVHVRREADVLGRVEGHDVRHLLF